MANAQLVKIDLPATAMPLNQSVHKLVKDLQKDLEHTRSSVDRKRIVWMLELLSRLDIGGSQYAIHQIDPFLSAVYGNGVWVNKDSQKAVNYSHQNDVVVTSNTLVTARENLVVPFFMFLIQSIDAIISDKVSPIYSFLIAPLVLATDLGLISYDLLQRDTNVSLRTALENSMAEGDKGHRIMKNAFKITVGALTLFVGGMVIGHTLIGLYALFSLYQLYKNAESVLIIDADIKYLENAIQKLTDVEPIDNKKILENELELIRDKDRPLAKQQAIMNSVLTFAILSGIVLLAMPPTAPIGGLILTVSLALQVAVMIRGAIQKRKIESQFPSLTGKLFGTPSNKYAEGGHFVQGVTIEKPAEPVTLSKAELFVSALRDTAYPSLHTESYDTMPHTHRI